MVAGQGPVEAIVRWRVFRLAVAAGWSWAGTYDWCLHPRTRVDVDELLIHYPAAAAPSTTPTGEGMKP